MSNIYITTAIAIVLAFILIKVFYEGQVKVEKVKGVDYLVMLTLLSFVVDSMEKEGVDNKTVDRVFKRVSNKLKNFSKGK